MAYNRIQGFTTAWEIKLESSLPGFFLLRNLSCLHTTIFTQSTFVFQKSVLPNLILRNKSCRPFKIGIQPTIHQSLPRRSGTVFVSEEGVRQVEKVVNFLCPSEQRQNESTFHSISRAIPSYSGVLLLLSHFSRVRLCDPIDGSPPGVNEYKNVPPETSTDILGTISLLLVQIL